MDPVTLVVGALAAGAAKGVTGAVSNAITDAYSAFRAAVKSKFAGNARAEDALEAHAEDPDAYAGAVAKHVRETGADQDPRIVKLAEQLMALMDPAGASTGKYTVDLRGAQGVQVGDHNNMTITSN